MMHHMSSWLSCLIFFISSHKALFNTMSHSAYIFTMAILSPSSFLMHSSIMRPLPTIFLCIVNDVSLQIHNSSRIYCWTFCLANFGITPQLYANESINSFFFSSPANRSYPLVFLVPISLLNFT